MSKDKKRGVEHPGPSSFPPRPIERFTTPLESFLHVETASGFVLFGCTIVALFMANSGMADAWQAFWNETFTVSLGSFALSYPLWYWVNDALMTLFFFVIGLEIKRELVAGELSDRRKVVVPVAGAIGGVLLPVLVFFSLQYGQPGARAWAVPMATDIAFVVGGLSLLGNRVPRGLKVFLLSLAIVDDIMAVIVIAAFYTDTLNLTMLSAALGGFALVFLLNRTGVRTVSAYFVVGSFIWLFTLKSGIHPTVAGVALGLMTPASAWLGHRRFLDVARRVLRPSDEPKGTREERMDALLSLRFASREVVSPLERLERALHPWVGFVIMPAFALANAGVAFSAETVGTSLSMAVAAGLVLGKPIGIVAASALVVKLGWARLPDGMGWKVMLAAGCLAGIGFTMSLFVASLALDGALLQEAKGGVLVGSGISFVLGMSLLYLFLPRKAAH